MSDNEVSPFTHNDEDGPKPELITQSPAALAIKQAIKEQSEKAVRSVPLKLFGQDVELRTPSFRMSMNTSDMPNADRNALMIIRYTVVPGTEERIFTDSDADMILNMPFGPDLIALQRAVVEITGLTVDDVDNEEEAIKDNPLDETSGNTPSS